MEWFLHSGDIVYSFPLLNLSLPDLKYEKLLMLMKINKLSFSKLKNIVNDLSSFKVHVIGDILLIKVILIKMIEVKLKHLPLVYYLKKKKIMLVVLAL